MKVIRTTEGYMVELPDGDFLCDMHGDNLWETRSEAEREIVLALGEEAMTQLEQYPTYHDVIDAVIAQIKVDLAKEDETAIVELLGRLPRKVLLSYLPEEETNELN
jgi:hypothetical protein